VIGAEADVSVEKTGPGVGVSGEQLTYTITVSNAGPSVAWGVTVVDSPGPGLTAIDDLTKALGELVVGQGTSYVFAVTIDPIGPPFVSNTVVVSSLATDPDSENDSSMTGTLVVTVLGTPLWWLDMHGLTNAPPNEEELLDRDGDGMAAWEEWIAGTNPRDILSVLKLGVAASAPGSGAVIFWDSVSGRVYRLYASTNLLREAGTWSNVYESAGDGSGQSYTSPYGDRERRFFSLGVDRRQ
jgi:uncharacterized repeat protein (TIGR01451 family)